MQQFKLLSNSFSQPLRRQRTNRMFASALVVSLLLIATVFLFSSCSQSQESSGDKPDTGPIISTKVGGLQLSATLPPGPYFLREMLGIDLSLTNNAQSPIYAGIPFVSSPCGYYSGVVITGGNQGYTLPVELGHGCPGDSNNVALQPGKTITVHTYTPLVSSGLLTVAVQTLFYKHTASANGEVIQSLDDPLHGNWPKTQLQVSPTVPKDHQILLKQESNSVSVSGPKEAQSNLVYAYKLTCGSISEGDLTETGNYSWDKSASSSIHSPQDSYCSGKKITWTYVFAASGYALASGTFHSS